MMALVLPVLINLACAGHPKEVVAAPPMPVGQPTPAPSGDGWIDLLAEDQIPNWQAPADTFTVSESVMHIPGAHPSRYLVYTGQTISDFELHVEFKLTPGANSGVFLRSNPDDPVQGGMEIQVYDDFGSPPGKHGCGALYDIATPMFNMSRPIGEWNSYDIRFEGGILRVAMNGWPVLYTDISKMTMPIGKFATPLAEFPSEGHLLLQDHGSELWYRNIMLKPINY